MVQRVVGAHDEDVEPIRTPRDGSRGADDRAAHELVAGDRRPPAAAVPPLVVQRPVGAGDEDVEPVGTPGQGLRHAGADATKALVAADRRPPGAAIPGLVVERPVGAEGKDVDPVRPPGHHWARAGAGSGSAAGAQADQAARPVQTGLHARDLTGAEHKHAAVVGVVHVVHEHVTVWAVAARDLRKSRHAGVRAGLIGGVGDVVGAGAAGTVVAPDVVQVQPVTDLVGSSATQVEGHCCGAYSAEGRVTDHHAIGRCRTARELRVAEQATGQPAHPDVEVALRRPGVRPAARAGFHRVVLAEGRDRSLTANDARGRVAVRVAGGQEVLDAGVGGQRQVGCRRAGNIGIGAPEVAVEHGNLALDLGVADVLRCGVPDDVDDDRDARYPGTFQDATVALEGDGLVLDGVARRSVFW